MPQQATIGPALMESIERTNMVVVRGSEVGGGQNMGALPRRDLFAMEVDWSRNCYACGGFGHMAHNCRNQSQRGRMVENRRVKYEGERIEEILNFVNNLKEEENLELLN